MYYWYIQKYYKSESYFNEQKRIFTSLDVRFFIVAGVQNQDKYTEIIDLVFRKYGISIVKSTISKIMKKYEEDGTVVDRIKSGRPRKLSIVQEKN